MGELKGHALQWFTRRGGRPWPAKCCGPGKHQHAKGCHPARPRCRWRRAKLAKRATCNCGTPHYPHRVGSVDVKRQAVCVHHPRYAQLMFELVSGQQWDAAQ